MQVLLHLVSPTLQQATSDPCLPQSLLDTHGQVWVSLLWGHCSFLLGPCVHEVLFVPSKAREFQKNIYFCFIDYAKAFDCVHHKKLWKILKEMGIPDHLTCLLRNRKQQLELDMEQQTGSK